MFSRMYLPMFGLALVLAASAPPAHAQGQGSGRDKAQKQAVEKKGARQKDAARTSQQRGKGNNDKARAKAADNQARGKAASQDNRAVRSVSRGASGRDATATAGTGSRSKSDRFRRVVHVDELHSKFRSYVTGKRASDKMLAAAAGIGLVRGLRADDLDIRRSNDRVLLHNGTGVLLLDIDERRARDLGGWHVRPYDDNVNAGAPSFCRSGEGHPVWGREWCLDKGFGLGRYRDVHWGRSTDVDDIVFRRATDRGTLARSVLLDVLGDVVFNRLGLHAVTLGYSDPLTGMWLREPTGPQVLRITSGGVPIAEIYDADRDNRADVLIVALREW